MPNVKQIIDGHNKTILKKDSQLPQDQAMKACNCKVLKVAHGGSSNALRGSNNSNNNN